jgi:hypothetical protein
MGPYQNVLPIVLLNAFPFLCVLAIWCLRFFEHLLPSKQHEMLEKFVKMAVTMAEQAYDDYSPLEKKRIALRAAIDLFNAFHLPVPQAEALNTAIEAAVFAVRQTQAQSKMVRDGRPGAGRAAMNPIVPTAHSSIVPNPDLLSTIPTQTL